MRGAGWIYSYRMVDRLLGFVSLTVLARLLDPEDFGLVAVAAAFVAVIEGLSEFDVKNVLIQSRDESRELEDTAWTLSLLRGLFTAGALCLVAGIATDDRVRAILYALAAVPLLDGISNPRFFRFERDLVFSKLAKQTLFATVATFSVTILVAWWTRSYWALVLGMLASALARSGASYALCPHRPDFSLKRWREILSFSGWMTLGSIVSTISMRSDRIIVGHFLGFAETGSYFMTHRIGVLPTSELISPLQRVLFPSFSRMVGDRPRLRDAVLRSVNVLGSLSLSAAMGFALLANDFVPLALGDKWRSIAPLLVLLVPFLGFRASLSSARPCVMALGRTELVFRASLAYALIHLPAFVFGTVFYGLRGAILSIVLAGVFYVYLNAWMLQESIGLKLREIVAQLLRPVLASAVMVGVCLTADRLLPIDLFSSEGSLLSLVIKLGLGGVSFCGALYGLWRLTGRPAGIEPLLFDAISKRGEKSEGEA